MVRTHRNFGEDLNGEQRRNGTRKKAGRRLNFATWNVRTLVENQGDPKIARKQPSTILSDTVVDRKFEFLTAELKQFTVVVAAIQETKWFGSDVWSSSGFTMLHSGRDLPRAEDESARRNEGVCLVLNMEMTSAWKNAGREWTAVSSRIVVARFKLADSGDHFALCFWAVDTKVRFIPDDRQCLCSYKQGQHADQKSILFRFTTYSEWNTSQ